MDRGECYKADSFLITDFKLEAIGIKSDVIIKYIDNLVSLKTDNIMGLFETIL